MSDPTRRVIPGSFFTADALAARDARIRDEAEKDIARQLDTLASPGMLQMWAETCSPRPSTPEDVLRAVAEKLRRPRPAAASSVPTRACGWSGNRHAETPWHTDRSCPACGAPGAIGADGTVSPHEVYEHAPSVPTGTRDPAVRWWTHGSCGPAPGNADGPRWTSCVGCGITPDQWTPYNPPTNGDDTDAR